ncbi:MAG: glycosyltransferase family 4 protein, partial [bacterium]|nr:glycosyltransferase family 4 protein [bacterium]
MNILIFSTAYLPLIGGAELAIKEITDRLPEHKFTLITARFLRALPTHERIGNVEVYRVGFGFSFDKWLLPFLGTRLAKRLTLEREPFSIIWSMMASQGSIAATRFKKAHPATKLVLTLQEGDEESHLKRYVFGNDFLYRLLIRPWHLLVFKRADVITAISNYLAERGRKHNSQVPIVVIPNGVDVAKFEARSTKSETNLKFKLGFKETDKIIV